MKGFVSVRQSALVGLVAALSVFYVISFSHSALWLLAVALGLELLAALWMHVAVTAAVVPRNPANRPTRLAMARFRETER